MPVASQLSPAPVAIAAPRAALDDEIEFQRFTRWADADGRVAESSLRIGGIHCAACAPAIEDALRAVPGVLQARVDAMAQCVAVRWAPALTRPSALVAAVEAAGYAAAPDTGADARDQRRREAREALWRFFVAAFCAMQVMMLAAPSYFGSSELAPDLKRLLDGGSWMLTLPVMAFSAAPFFAGAWRSLRAGRIGMDVPVALGIAVAFVASSGAAADPGGPFGSEVYFDSLTMFVAFLLGGRLLELRVRHAAARQLEAAVDRLPQTVWRETADGGVEAVSARRLRPGDVVRVPRGEGFAADGVLLTGSTRVDESLLSGESAPRPKLPGDAVVAGSLNLESPVVMQVQRVGADTRFEAIVALMRDARTRRPAATRTADRWAGPFLWGVLLLAAGSAAAWHLVDPARAVWVAVSVLIVTCPCALSLAAPAAWVAGAAALARRGVLLRNADSIEDLAAVQVLFVDKTGTLTEARGDEIRLRRHSQNASLQFDDASLWQRATSLAAWSTHPLAAALAARAAAGGVAWRDVHETPGEGVRGTDGDGTTWALGRGPSAADEDQVRGQVCLWRLGVPVAHFEIGETLRDGALDAVRALERDGVRVVIVSGDRAERVARIAALLGIGEWHAGATPEGKLALLRAAQGRGERVAMIGDGINDAPVLAQADVSLAMGQGAEIARSQADGVLLSQRLGDVAGARRLATRTLRVVRQNLAWAVLYNATSVPLAMLGWMPPWAAGLGMAGSSLLVIANALRLSR